MTEYRRATTSAGSAATTARKLESRRENCRVAELTQDDLRGLYDAVKQNGEADIMLVGDGSGTTVGSPCGWCVHIFDPKRGTLRSLSGRASSGTNNLSELMPYVHALWHIQTSLARAGKPTGSYRLRVLIVSDSEVTVKCGNGQYGRAANQALWAALDWFRDNGFSLVFHHVKRNSNPASVEADRVAGEERKGRV